MSTSRDAANNICRASNRPLVMAAATLLLAVQTHPCVARSPCPQMRDGAWQRYTFAGQESSIEYPTLTRPHDATPPTPGFFRQVNFPFNDLMQGGRTLGFSVDVGFAENAGGLSSAEWSKRDQDPKLILRVEQSRVGSQETTTVWHSSLVWPEITVYVSHPPMMVVLHSIDITAFGTLLPGRQKACWHSVVTRMMQSLSFTDKVE